jgi:hypothetical protein
MKIPMAAPIKLPTASAGLAWTRLTFAADSAIGAVVDALRPLGVGVDVASVVGVNAKLAVDIVGPPKPEFGGSAPPLGAGPPPAMLPLGPKTSPGTEPATANRVLGVTSAANAGVTALEARCAGGMYAGDGASPTAPAPAAASTPAANAAVIAVL